MTPNEKAKLLGLLFWIYTAFNIVLVAVIAVVYVGIFGFVLTQAPRRPGETPPPEFILPLIVVIFSLALVFTVLFSIPKIIAGYGLRKGKPWAKGWSIAGSIMACMSFPIGTALGVFGLIFILGEDGKKYFDDPRFQRGELAGAEPARVPEPSSWQ